MIMMTAILFIKRRVKKMTSCDIIPTIQEILLNLAWHERHTALVEQIHI